MRLLSQIRGGPFRFGRKTTSSLYDSEVDTAIAEGLARNYSTRNAPAVPAGIDAIIGRLSCCHDLN
jgi:hypothetical protein